MKLRYWFRLTKAFLLRFKAILFMGIVAGLLFFGIFRFLHPYIFPQSQEFIGLSGRYHIEELPESILELIGDGLTSIDATGQVDAGLAESWTSKEEGKVWEFRVKSDQYWHDGTPVLAEDIRYEFEDAQIKVTGENTLSFELNTPFAPFPTVVSRPTFKRGLLGTGEWRVVGLDIAGEYVQRLVLQNDNNERKVYRFYPTEDAAKTAFKLGEVDKLIDLLDPHPFDSWNLVKVNENPEYNRFVAVFFNNESDLFTGNKQLRQALSYAINKQDFNAPRATGPISPNSWAYNPQVKDYAYDVSRAQELVDELPEEMRQNLEFTLTTSPVLLTTAEKVANYWQEIGVKVNVNVVSVMPQDYDAFLAIYNIPRDPDQYSIWHGSQLQTNLSRFSNPRINLLLEEGRLELDQQERKKIYLDFQRFLLEESPAVFLYHPISYEVMRL